jgi:hypothetical protein
MTVKTQDKRTPRTARLAAAGGVVLRAPYAVEVPILRFISEQNAVTLDQLCRFFGIYVSDMARFVEAMRQQGWLEARPLIKGDLPWVWLRGKGAKLSGTGFSAVTPSLRTVGHWHAITEARLYLNEHAPDGVWICERKLRRKRYRGKGRRAGYRAKVAKRAHIPDALFKVEGEVHAIEAELSRKAGDDLERIVAQHSARYDAVVYFCAPVTYTDIKKKKLEDRYPRLFTCCLVENLRKLTKEQFRDPEDPRRGGYGAQRDPEVWEVAVLDLFAEQGAIPDDQLARFLKCSPRRAKEIAVHLLEAGFLKRAQPEEEEAIWSWLGTRSARFVTLDVGMQNPTMAGLPRLRAWNEVRLQILERTKGTIEWTSGRVLRREQGKEGSLPDAVAVEETGRGVDRRRQSYAIDVRLNLVNDLEKIFGRYQLRAEEYDWVVWYCAPQARKIALTLKEKFTCPKLVVRTIPGYRLPRGTRRRVKKSKKVVPRYRKVAAREVEAEVFEVVALAAAGETAITVSKVELREDTVSTEYRVSTDDGVWRVVLGLYGWKAEEILE